MSDEDMRVPCGGRCSSGRALPAYIQWARAGETLRGRRGWRGTRWSPRHGWRCTAQTL